MKKYALILMVIFFISNISFAKADVISGNIKEDVEATRKSQVIDSATGYGVDGAQISIPQKNYSTYTDQNGYFDLDTKINKKTILSVEKQGFRPFSITIDKNIEGTPLRLGIEQMRAGDVILNKNLVHLGDDQFSATSANSNEFKKSANGPFWSKKVTLKKPDKKEKATLVIGSIIGLDTKMAKKLGQNNIISVYSSPAEIIFNGKKISELTINGDNQEIEIPSSLITGNDEITIKTGKNLFQREYIDYDDMEFMNLRIEYREKSLFANFWNRRKLKKIV